MQRNKTILISVALVIAFVVIGLVMARKNPVDRSDVQASKTTDKAAVADRNRAKPKPAPKVSVEETTITTAAKENRYVFITFHQKGDEASKKMLAAIEAAKDKLSSRARFVSIDVDNPAHQDIVSRYGADRSPIPLTLVIAPNGAVTAGYPKEIKKTDFSDAFVSNGMASVLKVVQGQKLAAVCVQGPSTKNNKKSLVIAEELKADPQLGGAVEIVKIDPADRSEAKVLKDLGADTQSADAQLLVLAPPGRLIGKFDSSATKDAVMASLQSALGGGG